MTIEALKQFLRRYHLSLNKVLGQNFLLDEIVLQDMATAAGVQAGDRILEIGPGIGNLTRELLSRQAQVLAVEKDKKFLPLLRALQKEHKDFQFVIEDILKFNFQEYFAGQQYKVVANIPYYITGVIIQMLIRSSHKPTSITLLVQKEVARNLTAKPGQLNLLALSVQLFGEAHLVRLVPAGKFYPPPKVDSAIVHIAVSAQPRYAISDERQLFRVMRACFAGKRKQIHNTLVNNLRLERDVVRKILVELKIKPEARPQELTLEQWIKLSETVSAL